MNAVWARYRRTFLPTQILVLVVCTIAYYHLHANVQTIVSAILFMQIASFVGAWSAQRMRDRVEARRQSLPLDRRRL